MDFDVTKAHFVGCVEYAAHFARLRPLLYSLDGHAWEGVAKREWFPSEGLIFSVAADLKFSYPGSLWIFRAMLNSRAADGPDKYSLSQHRPATLLRVDLQAMDIEYVRRTATTLGIEAPAGTRFLALPELDDCWTVTPELVRDPDGLWRVPPNTSAKRVKTYKGTPESLCGIATPDGQFVLPPLLPPIFETRNWQETGAFVNELARDLPKWLPHGAQKDKARAAAQAFRDLAPHLADLSALKASDTQAALRRATALVDDAEVLTCSPDDIVGILTQTAPFKARISEEHARIKAEMEELALAEAQAMAGALHAKLIGQNDELKAEIELSEQRALELRAEIKNLGIEAANARADSSEKLNGLEAEFDALMKRISTKPAKILMEWVAASGFSLLPTESVSAVSAPSLEAFQSEPDVPPIRGMDLYRALRSAVPQDDKKSLKLLEWMDAAIRARELPILIGPGARPFAEAWLNIATTDNACIVVADPTLLSLRDFTPDGTRGTAAPLAKLFDRCHAAPQRLFVAMLDDPDPASATFWLPEFARAIKQPARYGFPSNLIVLCVFSSTRPGLDLSRAKSSDLFPLFFEADSATHVSLPGIELPLDAVAPPLSSSGISQRGASLERAALETFSQADAEAIGSAFRAFSTNGAKLVGAPTPLIGELTAALQCIISKEEEAHA